MLCYPSTAIYCLQLIILSLITVQCSPIYQNDFDDLNPMASSFSSSLSLAPSSSPSATSSLSSASPTSPASELDNQQIVSETQSPDQYVGSYQFPIKRVIASIPPPFSSSSSMLINGHHPLRFLIRQMIQNPEKLDGPYQRGRRYREHDKSFIRFGRALAQQALALWSRENRKRPEKNNDTSFLRFGRSQ